MNNLFTLNINNERIIKTGQKHFNGIPTYFLIDANKLFVIKAHFKCFADKYMCIKSAKSIYTYSSKLTHSHSDIYTGHLF